MSGQGRGPGSPISVEGETPGELRGWLGSGPIQSPSGAFYAWVDEQHRAGVLRVPRDHRLRPHLSRRAARPRSGGAAARRAPPRNGSPTASPAASCRARAGWDGDAPYSFDLAMISAGLISFGRSHGQRSPSEAGLELAAMLAGAAIGPWRTGPDLRRWRRDLEGRLVGRGPAAPGEVRPVPARGGGGGARRGARGGPSPDRGHLRHAGRPTARSAPSPTATE